MSKQKPYKEWGEFSFKSSFGTWLETLLNLWADALRWRIDCLIKKRRLHVEFQVEILGRGEFSIRSVRADACNRWRVLDKGKLISAKRHKLIEKIGIHYNITIPTNEYIFSNDQFPKLVLDLISKHQHKHDLLICVDVRTVHGSLDYVEAGLLIGWNE